MVEKWCKDFYLNHTSLLMADALYTELTDTLKRIELPVSVPAFGSRSNTFNIKRALLAGFFMQVRQHDSIHGITTHYKITVDQQGDYQLSTVSLYCIRHAQS